MAGGILLCASTEKAFTFHIISAIYKEIGCSAHSGGTRHTNTMRKWGTGVNQDRRTVILDEIEYWRENRLLPEHYCDFLSNLYDVDHEHDRGDKKLLSMSSLKQGNLRTWLFIFLMLCFICLVVLYFSAFPFLMQLVSVPIFAAVCYISGIRQQKRNPVASSVLLSIGSFLLLGLGIMIIHEHRLEPTFWIPVLVIGCAIIWCIMGYVISSPILLYIGFGALVLLYGGFFAQVKPDASWIMLQALWLPLSMLFVWFSWLVHHRGRKLAAVYFTSGVAIWFMPEVDETLLRGHMPDIFAVLCIVKIALACILLFVLRKKWIVWVTA